MSPAPAIPAPVRRLAAVALLGVLTLGLTACGAGFAPQTYAQRNVGDGTNAAAGAVAIRNATIEPPSGGIVYEQGEDARVLLTITNDGPDEDRLVDATSPVAATVDILQRGSTASTVSLPRLSTTGDTVELALRGLQEEVRSGEYVELTLQFERGGEATLQVPVATRSEREPRPISSNFVHEDAGGDH